jgi:hypothetical protein
MEENFSVFVNRECSFRPHSDYESRHLMEITPGAPAASSRAPWKNQKTKTIERRNTMRLIPVLHIIFYLATLLLPEGTTQFTISSGYEPKLTWVREVDGQWRAITATGREAGYWSVNSLVVSVTAQGTTTKTDISAFVNVATAAGKQRTISLDGKTVTVISTTNRVTLSQAEGGLLGKAMVIGYSAK